MYVLSIHFLDNYNFGIQPSDLDLKLATKLYSLTQMNTNTIFSPHIP